jgi:cytochrome c-type biogenesis protein CcmH/NrfG
MGTPSPGIGGVELLRSQLPFDAKSASALAFLATIVKDFSHLDAACALYDEAARLVPTSASYALNYAHTLEVSGR